MRKHFHHTRCAPCWRAKGTVDEKLWIHGKLPMVSVALHHRRETAPTANYASILAEPPTKPTAGCRPPADYPRRHCCSKYRMSTAVGGAFPAQEPARTNSEFRKLAPFEGGDRLPTCRFGGQSPPSCNHSQ